MKDTVRHLHRKLQHNNAGFPSDLLQPISVDLKFAGHVGFPEGDSLAYEPVQSLLAVGTPDGRVKLIGRPGVELTLRSSSRSPTKYLGFLKNKGAVLRVTQDADIQLFSVVERRLVASTWLQGDAVVAVALLPDDPYILLGCETGNVRVVALLDGQGRPAEGARAAADLSLQPYQVLAQDLDAKGAVVSLDVTRLKGRPLLLVVHRNSGALVWDVRAEKIVCAALDDEHEASKPTCACWVGERANCFAVGYDDGSLLLYGVPQPALQEDPLKVSAPADAQLLMTFRVAPAGARAAPVKALSFVKGAGGADWLLVFGGQPADEPDMLTKLPLQARAAGQTLPWFGAIKGFALVPDQGSLNDNDDPAAAMVLTEGGQLVVHDLRSWQPVPLTLPFQELPPISLSCMVPTVSLALLGLGGAGDPSDTCLASPGSAHSGRSRSAAPERPSVQHALTLDTLARVGRRAGAPAGGTAAAADAWPLHAGQPAARWGAAPPSAAAAAGEAGASGRSWAFGRHPSALYCTGHRDGRVRVWDATTCVPTLLLAMPSAAQAQERLRPVTALEVCPFSGIAVVGHAGGEVRLYQFADCQQPEVHRMNLDESGVPYDNVGAQPAGFQYVMRYGLHSADVTAVCLASKLKLAAVADEAGCVSLLDLMQPALLWTTKAMPRPVRHLALGCHVMPAPERRGEKDKQPAGAEQAGSSEIERLVLFAGADDSTLAMLSLEKGEVLEKPLKPKNASRPLAMVLLDANGQPVPPPQGAMTFPWANNNVTVPLTAHELAAEAAEAAMRQLAVGEVPLPNLLPRPAAGAAAGAAVAAQRQASVGSEGGGRGGGAAVLRGASTEPPESSTGDSLELRELPSDEELDTQLASSAAAAASPAAEAAAQKPGSKKFKLPKGFLRPKRATSVEPDLPSPTTPGPPRAAPGAAPGAKPAPLPASAAASPQHSLSLEATAGPSGGAEELDAAADAAIAAHQPTSPSGAVEPEEPAVPADTIGSPTLSSSLAGEKGSAAPAPRAPERPMIQTDDLVDYPYLIDAEPMPAAYLLLCTEDYLRVYSTENVRLGDRSTERKASEESPLVLVGIFHSVHGPGVATIASDGALSVRTVPGLDCIYRLRLDHSSVLGFKWPFGAGAEPGGSAGSTAAACACSLDGQLLLVGPSNEIARLVVVQDCVEPAAPVSAYDPALAEAANAALQAHAAALARQRSSNGDYVVREAPLAPAEAEAGVGVGASGADSKAEKKGLGRFFSGIKGTASEVLDTATKTAQTVVQGTMSELDKGIKLLSSAAGGGGEGSSGSGGQYRRELPSLPVLFATPVEPLEDDIDYMTDEEEPSPASAATSPRPLTSPATSAGGAPPGATAAGSSITGKAAAGGTGAGLAGMLRRAGSNKEKEEKKKQERGELMQGAAARPDFKSGGATHMRTASSIREAYGRPRHTQRTEAVRGIMEQNKRMLAERGEKLQDLEQRTAQMQDDASDFASLAKELESAYANRKWWQL